MLVFNHSLLSLVEYYQHSIGIKITTLQNVQSTFFNFKCSSYVIWGYLFFNTKWYNIFNLF